MEIDRRKTAGQTIIEYALLLFLVGGISLLALVHLGSTTASKVSCAGSGLAGQPTCATTKPVASASPTPTPTPAALVLTASTTTPFAGQSVTLTVSDAVAGDTINFQSAPSYPLTCVANSAGSCSVSTMSPYATTDAVWASDLLTEQRSATVSVTWSYPTGPVLSAGTQTPVYGQYIQLYITNGVGGTTYVMSGANSSYAQCTVPAGGTTCTAFTAADQVGEVTYSASGGGRGLNTVSVDYEAPTGLTLAASASTEAAGAPVYLAIAGATMGPTYYILGEAPGYTNFYTTVGSCAPQGGPSGTAESSCQLTFTPPSGSTGKWTFEVTTSPPSYQTYSVANMVTVTWG